MDGRPTQATAGGPVPTPEQLAQIYAAARRAYPAEACGLVRASGVRECLNAVEEPVPDGLRSSGRTVATGYALAAADLLDLARSFDTDDPVLLIYHSHPEVGAYFSAEDQRFAVTDREPTYPVDHLVVDAAAAGVRGARRFRFSPSAGRYLPAEAYGAPLPADGLPPFESR